MTIIRRTTDNYFDASGTAIPLDQVSDVDPLEARIAALAMKQVLYEGETRQGYGASFAEAFNDGTGINSASTGVLRAGVYQSDAPTFMLQSETTNGSVVMTDSAGGKTITVEGDTQHSTAQAKFGSSSIIFDGTGDYMTVADHAAWDFGTSDWTISLWYRATTWNANNIFLTVGTNATGVRLNQFAGAMHVHVVNTDFDFTWAPSTNNWYHIAVVRSGNNLNFYVNGTATGGTKDVTGKDVQTSDGLTIGANQPVTAGILTGHMEELRIDGTEALWTANFTPPTEAASITSDWTLQLEPYASGISNPTSGRIIMPSFEAESITYGTDLKMYLSRDGGTTFSEASTYSEEGLYATSTPIIASSDIDISGQPSGSSMVAKIVKFNDKLSSIPEIWAQWS